MEPAVILKEYDELKTVTLIIIGQRYLTHFFTRHLALDKFASKKNVRIIHTLQAGKYRLLVRSQLVQPIALKTDNVIIWENATVLKDMILVRIVNCLGVEAAKMVAHHQILGVNTMVKKYKFISN